MYSDDKTCEKRAKTCELHLLVLVLVLVPGCKKMQMQG
jgi:hypothetical protein